MWDPALSKPCGLNAQHLVHMPTPIFCFPKLNGFVADLEGVNPKSSAIKWYPRTFQSLGWTTDPGATLFESSINLGCSQQKKQWDNLLNQKWNQHFTPAGFHLHLGFDSGNPAVLMVNTSYRMGPPLVVAFSCLKKVAEFYGSWWI